MIRGLGMKTCRICSQAKPLEAYRGTRNACRECENAVSRARYAAMEEKPYQRKDMKTYYRRWYTKNRERLIAKATAYNQAHPEMRRKVSRENLARQREKLTDAYVRRLLVQSTGLKAADIPQPLVEAQRELLKIKRYIREHSI